MTSGESEAGMLGGSQYDGLSAQEILGAMDRHAARAEERQSDSPLVSGNIGAVPIRDTVGIPPHILDLG